MYQCTVDLLFDWFGISCMTTSGWKTTLLTSVFFVWTFVFLVTSVFLTSWDYADGIDTDDKYRCLRMLDWLVSTHPMTTDNFHFYLQNRLIQTGQTGGQLYSDTYPFSVPKINMIL